MEQDTTTRYLTTEQAADFLGLKTKTLHEWRGRGEGPAIHRFGRLVRYTREDLEAWADAQREELRAAG